MSELFSFVVDKSGVRLDRYIAEELSEVSRTRVQELIREGRVKVNGRPAKPGIRLDAGDEASRYERQF